MFKKNIRLINHLKNKKHYSSDFVIYSEIMIIEDNLSSLKGKKILIIKHSDYYKKIINLKNKILSHDFNIKITDTEKKEIIEAFNKLLMLIDNH